MIETPSAPRKNSLPESVYGNPPNYSLYPNIQPTAAGLTQSQARSLSSENNEPKHCEKCSKDKKYS